MSRVLRLVLIGLMVLAVPFKGAAATAMLSCGEAHHGVGTTAAAHGPHDTVAGEERAAAHGHEHAHEAPVTALHAPDADNDDSSPAGAHMLKCSACAPCCAAAAPGSEAIALGEPDVVAFVGREVDPWCSGVTGDLPDRPPRPILT
jgi:hypothetical protein